jgi:hypothetical protein
MPTSLAPGDRKLLIIAVLLITLLSVVALLLSPKAQEASQGFASSYSTDSGGAKAAYLLLGELGYPVERWVRPPQELTGLSEADTSPNGPGPAANTVLVLADPLIPATSDERMSLQRFVRLGGEVLVTGSQMELLLPSAKLESPRGYGAETKTYRAELPAPLTRNAPEISMKAYTRWGPRSGPHLRYYGDEGGATVVSYSIGKGRVIWWADSGPLTNYGLTETSNLNLFLNSIGEPVNKHVLWDEYFHGQRLGFWSYLGRTPIPWSMVQLGLVLVAAFITFGRRNGPVRALRVESRLSPLEFVETLGDLYQHKGGASEALGIAYQRFRFVLLRRLGLAPAASPQDIQRGVRERLGWSVPGFAETLQRCELGVKDRKLTGPRSLLLIQELHDYARRFGLTKAESRN